MQNHKNKLYVEKIYTFIHHEGMKKQQKKHEETTEKKQQLMRYPNVT